MPEQNWKITTAPAIEPITLAEAKLHLRVGVPGGTASSITKANPGVVTKHSHGLASGDVITWTAASGMVELNAAETTVTYVTDDTFSIGTNTTGYTASDGTETYSFNHEDDDAITKMIQTAREQVEGDEGRSLITRTITLKMDKFPPGSSFTLPRPPLIAVTSIKYQDSEDVQQTWAAANYVVDAYSEPGRVVLAMGIAYPSTYGEANDVEVIYTAGYGDAATDVPATSKAAMLLQIGDLYDHRKRQIERTALFDNPAYKALIQKNKVEIYA